MVDLTKTICSKKVVLTEHEFKEYLLICSRFTEAEKIFENVFETDVHGRIVYIRSVIDKEKQEVVMFLQNLMLNQWLRYGMAVIDKKEKELDIRIKLLDNKIALLSKQLDKPKE